jgi:hypothetical protein
MTNTIDGIHTITNPKGTRWANVSNGVILSAHNDKNTAVAAGRLLAKRHGANLTIHRRDGSVVEIKSYTPGPIAA